MPASAVLLIRTTLSSPLWPMMTVRHRSPSYPSACPSVGLWSSLPARGATVALPSFARPHSSSSCRKSAGPVRLTVSAKSINNHLFPSFLFCAKIRHFFIYLQKNPVTIRLRNRIVTFRAQWGQALLRPLIYRIMCFME